MVKIEITLLVVCVLVLFALSTSIFMRKTQEAASEKVPAAKNTETLKNKVKDSESNERESEAKAGDSKTNSKGSESDLQEFGSDIENPEGNSNHSETDTKEPVYDLAYVLDHPEDYPQEFIDALKRNPEILDFVLNYPDAAQEASGGLTAQEKSQACPLMLQWDSRWGYVSYGNNNIGISGCGPTCLSMVIYGLTRNEEATPDTLADVAMKGGYYVWDEGTDWSFMTDAAKTYGLTVSQQPYADESQMKSCLDSGGLIITSMTPGDFTDQGHFIVIYGYEGDQFQVNDPFSNANSSTVWDYETLSGQIKQVWLYYIQ